MTAVSAFVMHALMYLNTWELGHVEFSQTRVWMTLIMAAGMLPVMLGFMWKMYPNRGANLAILLFSAVLMAVSVWGVRSQRFVDDIAWMRAMIPHHSIAILTSTRAQITDPRVRELADSIIDAQNREIEQMQTLIADLER
ncbi:DUF305 domain-containing protein [Thioclava sp. FR2]|uniref:DUF305 domain-containing protein n=1 Tax=Thioclava sp. FR2 TaxID=3445780 RepID=UPI003EBD5C58